MLFPIRTALGGRGAALGALAALAALCLFFVIISRFFADPAAAGAAAGAGDAATRTHRFAATADTYVNSKEPTRNYGAAPVLKADSGPASEAYLRFSVEGLTGRVVTAKLRLHRRDSSRDGGSVARMSAGSWDEGTVTYANRPAI